MKKYFLFLSFCLCSAPYLFAQDKENKVYKQGIFLDYGLLLEKDFLSHAKNLPIDIGISYYRNFFYQHAVSMYTQARISYHDEKKISHENLSSMLYTWEKNWKEISLSLGLGVRYSFLKYFNIAGGFSVGYSALNYQINYPDNLFPFYQASFPTHQQNAISLGADFRIEANFKNWVPFIGISYTIKKPKQAIDNEPIKRPSGGVSVPYFTIFQDPYFETSNLRIGIAYVF